MKNMEHMLLNGILRIVIGCKSVKSSL